MRSATLKQLHIATVAITPDVAAEVSRRRLASVVERIKQEPRFGVGSSLLVFLPDMGC